MELLDILTIRHGIEERTIELYRGDLTEMTPEDAVDILVVSAFPDDYTPTTRSLIGALDRKGISVEKLAASKAVDLRPVSSCWLSQEIPSDIPGIRFKRVVCFEPQVKGSPPEVVGDIFRSLVAIVSGNGTDIRIAMPLVASGNQGARAMLAPLLDAWVHWTGLGLPLKRLKIVEIDAEKAAGLQREFSALKTKYQAAPVEPPPSPGYDIFVSYAREDNEKVDILAHELHRCYPEARIFLDRKELDPGVAWQQKIFEALDACRKVVVIYSPAYLCSKVCQEEFHIAYYRHREAKEPILFPIYLYSAALPTYMKALVQYVDCREGDDVRLRSACREVLKGT